MTYWSDVVLMDAISAVGDLGMVRCAGNGAETIGPLFNGCSSSDPGPRLPTALVKLCAPRAGVFAVARAVSSVVPVWWFWCRIRAARRVNVFWYGRLPEWMRRCRASVLESLKG